MLKPVLKWIVKKKTNKIISNCSYRAIETQNKIFDITTKKKKSILGTYSNRVAAAKIV